MKKSKILILGSIASLGAIPFVAAKCGNENQNSIKEDKTDSQSKSEKSSGTVKKDTSENSTIDKKENETAPKKQLESENSKSEKSDSVSNMNTEMPKVTESVANETDDGESISDILDDEAKKYFKKEIDAEYENIEKMINKVLKSDSDKKSEVLEYFKKIKDVIKLNVW
ncbi:variable surface lipoprotein [Mycoplasmopsis bovis]|uniref:variable surface lipoprotein n=1 Tax=Mycoplasmopsis bovis TaxID=28903 RepID=UPI0024BBC401|nr:variable surface lipoprotein [Mycoplasmopsis bovis]WHO17066.1 variable surface lipoprotein [Mycoplasmopsis bovis]